MHPPEVYLAVFIVLCGTATRSRLQWVRRSATSGSRIHGTNNNVFPKSGTEAERLAVFNAVKGVERAQQYYCFPQKGSEDVQFDLVEIEKIPFGQDFSVTVHIQVSCLTSSSLQL